VVLKLDFTKVLEEIDLCPLRANPTLVDLNPSIRQLESSTTITEDIKEDLLSLDLLVEV